MFRFKLASVLCVLGTVVLAQQLPFNAASPVNSPNLADLLTVNSRASIFYDYCRENSLFSTRLISPSPTTLFVPTNAVMQALARKPSSGPVNRSFSIKSRAGEEEDRAYLAKWLSLHITAGAIDLESEDDFMMMSGKKCSLKQATASSSGDFSIQRAFHRMRLMPADIEIIDVIEASNGRIIFINGSLSVED